MATVLETRPSGLMALVNDIVAAFDTLPNAFAATEEFRRMDAMTDAQLAAKGLKRVDLPRIVYNNHFA